MKPDIFLMLICKQKQSEGSLKGDYNDYLKPNT